MMTPEPLDNDALWALARMEERAAFLGHFDPIALAPLPKMKASLQLIASLSEQCEEVVVDNRLAWSLTPDARGAIFRRLKNETRLEEVALQSERRDQCAADGLGNWLVKLVLESPRDLSSLTHEEMDKVRMARALVGQFVDHPLPDVDALLERRAADEALNLVRSPELIGREHELKQLHRFVTSGSANALVVTGIGGSGKSALLAEFVYRLRRPDWRGPMVAWFDFDRALFANFDHTAMIAELARQLGLFLPSSDSVRTFRNTLERLDRSASAQNSRSYVEHARGASNAQSLWHHYIAPNIVQDRTIVLILDTYEEIVMRGNNAVQTMTKWVDLLFSELGLHGLKIVFSGRALPQLPNGSRQRFAEPLPVGERGPTNAVALLRQLVRREVAQTETITALVSKFGGNPLVLKIIGRHLSASGAAAATELLDDDYRPGTSDPLAQGVLYTRILGRLRSTDPDLRKLAHPGLVLRRVTPQLIAAVLAGPCGLGEISSERATALFAALKKQVWLVEVETPTVLLHRKDLRSLMLRLIEGDMVYQAYDIHRLAVAYYEQEKDALLDAASQRLEAQYHQLFLDQLPQLDLQPALRLLDAVGLDIDCAPLAARATLKYAAGRALSASEERALLHDALGAYNDEQARSAYDAGMDMPSQSGAMLQQSGRLGAPFGSAQVLQAFAQGEFRKISEQSEQLVEAALAARDDSRLSPERRDLVDSTLWRVALVALGEGTQESLATMITTNWRYREADNAPWIRDVRGSIGYARALDSVVRLLSPTIALPERHRSEPVAQLRTTDQLRAYQLLGAEPDEGKAMTISVLLLRYMQKSFRNFTATLDKPSDNADGSGHWKLADPVPEVFTLGVITEAMANARPVRLADIPDTPAGRRLILGIVPEMYPVLRGAFQAARDQQLVQMAGDAQALASDAWPLELSPKAFRINLGHDREKWLTVLIETADRYGKLEEIVLDALKRWNLFKGFITLQNMTMALEQRLQSMTMVSRPQWKGKERRLQRRATEPTQQTNAAAKNKTQYL